MYKESVLSLGKFYCFSANNLTPFTPFPCTVANQDGHHINSYNIKNKYQDTYNKMPERVGFPSQGRSKGTTNAINSRLHNA